MKPGLVFPFLIIALLLAVSPVLAGTSQGHPPTGSLTVEISGFRNNDGVARACLYDSEKGFPLKPEHAIRVVSVGIAGNRARAVFRDVPPGTYAVSVLHDENGNGRMDTNSLGMPKEGVGASNNPRSILGPPDFEDARFTYGGGDKTVPVMILYP